MNNYNNGHQICGGFKPNDRFGYNAHCKQKAVKIAVTFTTEYYLPYK